MSLLITKNGTDAIASKAKSLKITRELDHRGSRISFRTYDEVAEWDEIRVENSTGELLFAGVVEKVNITASKGGPVERQITSTGYKRFFDRKKIARRYENMTAGDIVRDILADWTEGFTEGEIQDGVVFENVAFNYSPPSEALSQLASKIGFAWEIDLEKRVHFRLRAQQSAPEAITDDSANFRNLKVTPDVSEMVNSVIIRGGTYTSTQQTFRERGDGEKTQFVLPEKPKNVSVFVNGAQKTVSGKAGDDMSAATTDFVYSNAEKYVENGLHSVLADTDVLEVRYEFEVPLRLRKRNLTSIAELQKLFPETDGVFEKVIEDRSIDSRELATELATEHLNLFSNAKIEASFTTPTSTFLPGQEVRIEANGVSKSAVVEKVVAKNIAGEYFEYDVKCATVLFGFEDFLRSLLLRGKMELNESEVVETIENLEEGLLLGDSVEAMTHGPHSQAEGLNMTESYYSELTDQIEYVLGPYIPASHTDTKRQFILDYSALG